MPITVSFSYPGSFSPIRFLPEKYLASDSLIMQLFLSEFNIARKISSVGEA